MNRGHLESEAAREPSGRGVYVRPGMSDPGPGEPTGLIPVAPTAAS